MYPSPETYWLQKVEPTYWRLYQASPHPSPGYDPPPKPWVARRGWCSSVVGLVSSWPHYPERVYSARRVQRGRTGHGGRPSQNLRLRCNPEGQAELPSRTLWGGQLWGPCNSGGGRGREEDRVRNPSLLPSQQWDPEQVFQLFCACFISNNTEKKNTHAAHLSVCCAFIALLLME